MMLRGGSSEEIERRAKIKTISRLCQMPSVIN